LRNIYVNIGLCNKGGVRIARQEKNWKKIKRATFVERF